MLPHGQWLKIMATNTPAKQSNFAAGCHAVSVLNGLFTVLRGMQYLKMICMFKFVVLSLLGVTYLNMMLFTALAKVELL